MLFRRTRFYHLSVLGQEAFLACRGCVFYVWAETRIGSRSSPEDRCGCPSSFHLLDVSLISQLDPNCSLVNDQIEMDQVKPAETYPNTFVPGRNMVFLTFVAILARSKGIHHLVTGVSEADFSGYPDCRDTFIRSLNVTLNLAMDDQFVIHTPLMDRDKSEVWELSDELGVFDLVRTQTLTCYNGVMADGCGHCPACRLRKAGLEKYLERKAGKHLND